MAAADQPILDVRDLRTYFFREEGTVKAVDGASFEVFAGRTVGIVGESGCGKTVTAKSILPLVGSPKPERRIDEYAFQLSGGLRQRAMIALALGGHPRILIADEPTTALDVTTQAQILDLLRHLQAQEQMAIVLITHNLGVVAEMCDEVVVMYLGRVVERGPVDAIFHAPKHPYTRMLLRSIPSIHARVRTKLPTIAGSIPHPFNRPRGCPFHPRCPDFMPGVCDQNEPELRAVSESQAVSCFLYGAP